MQEQPSNPTRSIPNTTDVEMTTSSQSLTNESTSSQSSVESTSKPTITGNQGEAKTTKQTTATTKDQEQSATTPSNPCVLCLTKEKRLACIPCGHLAICEACGHSLRSCPICRREIEAFVRVYI
jgi:Zinc finger, C3HC4 type (RING finger)